jgi:hypothetical protein
MNATQEKESKTPSGMMMQAGLIKRGLDGGSQRLLHFRIDDLGLGLGQRCRQRADLMAGSLHGEAPL